MNQVVAKEPVLDSSEETRLLVDGMIDAERGTVSREIFVSERIFDLELRNLFSRAWLFVAHESQIPEPGDFFQSRMGVDSVLVSRSDDGSINVFLNSCRHRGMKVCRYDEGSATEFTCPYHGWSYSVDGTLVSTPGELFGVPGFGMYGGKLDKKQWSLIRTPKIHNYKGLIFASWDPGAPDFEDYLGDFRFWIDNLANSLTGEPGGAYAVRGVLKWRVRANWKFVAENFLGDTYHGEPTHPSVDAVGIGPGGMAAVARGVTRHGVDADVLRNWDGETSFPALGHGACNGLDIIQSAPWFEEPELTEYFKTVFEKRAERYAAEGRPLGANGPGTLFPAMSFHAGGFPRGLMAIHPISATRTELWRWILVDEDAPPEVADWLRRYYMRYGGPAGLTEQDDMENWDYASAASRGYIARQYPYNYQLGMGFTKPDDRIKGGVVATTSDSEENARNYYRRWRAFVRGNTWAELGGHSSTY
jgi:phenylpropionate dioxygenase-like ring-hydroxylating dioxygenase large terminal subunit